MHRIYIYACIPTNQKAARGVQVALERDDDQLQILIFWQ